jgi:hypothetical protein
MGNTLCGPSEIQESPAAYVRWHRQEQYQRMIEMFGTAEPAAMESPEDMTVEQLKEYYRKAG